MVNKNRDEIARERASDKNAERIAKFGPVDEEEMQRIVNERTQGLLNDKRQNYVQAFFEYAMSSFRVRQMSHEYDRLTKVYETDRYEDAKDEFGLPLSKEEFLVILQAKHADLRFATAKVNQRLEDLKKRWDMTDEEIEKQIKDWILGSQKIY